MLRSTGRPRRRLVSSWLYRPRRAAGAIGPAGGGRQVGTMRSTREFEQIEHPRCGDSLSSWWPYTCPVYDAVEPGGHASVLASSGPSDSPLRDKRVLHIAAGELRTATTN